MRVRAHVLDDCSGRKPSSTWWAELSGFWMNAIQIVKFFAYLLACVLSWARFLLYRWGWDAVCLHNGSHSTVKNMILQH